MTVRPRRILCSLVATALWLSPGERVRVRADGRNGAVIALPEKGAADRRYVVRLDAPTAAEDLGAREQRFADDALEVEQDGARPLSRFARQCATPDARASAELVAPGARLSSAVVLVAKTAVELASAFANRAATLSGLLELNVAGVILGPLVDKIGTLTSLQLLRADGCGLRELPTGILALRQLRLLSLAHNQLRELPRELGNLQNLAFLLVDGNSELRELPIDALKELLQWSARGCALTQIPSARSARKLKSISIERNLITVLVDGGPTISPITCLNAAHNSLARLPNSISVAFAAVSKLALGCNSLCSLPESFALLPLVELDLSYNRFTVLPPAICSLRNLEHLDMTGNLVERVPDEVRGLRALQALWLSDNKLTHVDVDALLSLDALDHLGLATELGGEESNGALDAQLIALSRTTSGAALRAALAAWLEGSRVDDASALAHPDLKAIFDEHHRLTGKDDLSGLESIVASRFDALPAFIGKLSELRRLELSFLAGGCKTLPDSWRGLSSLRTLSLSGEPTGGLEARRRGPLSGGLPPWIGSMASLLHGARAASCEASGGPLRELAREATRGASGSARAGSRVRPAPRSRPAPCGVARSQAHQQCADERARRAVRPPARDARSVAQSARGRTQGARPTVRAHPAVARWQFADGSQAERRERRRPGGC